MERVKDMKFGSSQELASEKYNRFNSTVLKPLKSKY